MNNQWDYIVIGAGHNGLTAACTVAKAGKSVLVVDQRPILGGLSASYPYLENAPNHLLSIGAMDDAFLAASAVNSTFDLKNHGYTPIPLAAPYGWMNEEGDSLLLFCDFNKAVEEIRYFSPRDAKTYQEVRSSYDFLLDTLGRMGSKHPKEFGKRDIFATLLRLAKDKNIRKNLSKMIAASAFEMIYETFESEAMRGLWAFWMSMMGPANLPGTGVFMMGFSGVHRNGIYRPKGGMTGVVGALANNLIHYGGEILLNSPVEQILVDGSTTATGIRLTSGQELQANKGVLASCAPQVALGKLLPEETLDPLVKKRVALIPANSAGVAPFKIDIAATGKLGYPKAQQKRNTRDSIDLRKTTFMTGTLDDHIAQHNACIRGEQVTFKPPMYFSILSGADPSIAPPEGDVLYVYGNVPVKPQQGWQVEKPAYERQLMEATSRYIGGLETEIGRVVTCPQDFMAMFSLPSAAYNHVDSLPTRMGINRPAPTLGGYQTPVKNLFLAGSGSHPGGGVSGMPGFLAAQFALK